MSGHKSLYPEVVIVEDQAREDPLVRRILQKLPGAEIRYLQDANDPLSAQQRKVDLENTGEDSPQAKLPGYTERYVLGKKTLILKRHLGAWLRACPGTSDHVCCNLFTVNPGEGCPMDCAYCYLQTYLKNNPTLKLYTNTGDLFQELGEKFMSSPGRLFRVGTGEVIDSLVWDDLTDFTLEAVPFFASFENAVLELKTKSVAVENLLKLRNEHLGKTVVSWSVNAKSISENEENFTATINDRIRAAEEVIDSGYRVGFHFDPLVYFDGWKDEYSELVSNIFSRIPADRVAWVSVSSLRMKPDLLERIQDRFPESMIAYGEQMLASDNKLRYIQPLRFELTKFVWNELKNISSTLPVYMCMESAAAWRSIAKMKPQAGDEIREVFARRASLPIVS